MHTTAVLLTLRRQRPLCTKEPHSDPAEPAYLNAFCTVRTRRDLGTKSLRGSKPSKRAVAPLPSSSSASCARERTARKTWRRPGHCQPASLCLRCPAWTRWARRRSSGSRRRRARAHRSRRRRAALVHRRSRPRRVQVLALAGSTGASWRCARSPAPMGAGPAILAAPLAAERARSLLLLLRSSAPPTPLPQPAAWRPRHPASSSFW